MVTVDYSGGGSITGPGGVLVGTLKDGYAPPWQIDVLAGINSGAWLYLSITTSGKVRLYHVFGDTQMTWAIIHATASYEAE